MNHSRVKLSGVFAKTFFLLMATSIILLLLYNLVFVRLIRDTYDHAITEINTQFVATTSAFMDMILANIAKEALVLSQNRDILHASLVPSFDHNRRNAAISDALRNIVNENPLIDAVAVFIPSHDLAFYSNGQIGHADDVDMAGELRYAKHDVDKSGFYFRPEPNGKPSLTYYLNFPHGKKLFMGMISVEINRKALFEAVVLQGVDDAGHEDGENNVMVVDADGNAVISPAHTTLPKIAHPISADRPAGHVTRNVDGMIFGFYYHLSALTGWRVVQAQRTPRSLLSERFLTSIFLPMTLLYLLFSILIAIYVSRRVSRPVAELARRVADRDPIHSGQAHRDEYEVIGEGLERYKRERNELSLMVAGSTPYIVDDYLRLLLQGKALEPDETQFFSRYLPTDYYRGARYLVGIFQPRLTTPEEGDTEGGHADVESLARRIHETRPPESCHVFTTMDLSKVIVLTVFPAEEGEDDAKAKGHAAIAGILERLFRDGAGAYVVGVSRLHTGAEQARLTLGEALEALKYKLYLEADGIIDIEEISQLAASARARETGRDHAEDIRRVVNAVSAGDSALARDNLAALIRNIRESTPLEDKHIKGVFTQVVDALHRYVQAAALDVDGSMTDLTTPYRNFHQLATFAEQSRAVGELCDRLAEKVRGRITTRYNKYVVAARAYVAENYANSDITLNRAAASLGINATYLSRLFK